MRSVDEHLDVVLSGVAPLAPLELGILEARGCYLARPVLAPTAMPAFDHAGIFGYAVLASDLADVCAQRPRTLEVVDDVPAGYRATRTVRSGTAIRIMAGAPMPPGADAVVDLDDTDSGMPVVTVLRHTYPGHGVRLAGQELESGGVVAPEGTFIGAREVALLAAAGVARISVRPKPRVVVISTGTELVEPGARMAPGLLPDANGYMLTAAAEDAGALAYRAGPVPDEQRALSDTLEDQLVRADLIVTTGGVAAGTYDTVKTVLSRLGSVEFTRIAMTPGMPQGHGYLGPDTVPIFTLPGNPVSASIAFEVFVRPVIRSMLGHTRIFRALTPARLTRDLQSPPGVRSFIHANLSGPPGRADVTPVSQPGVRGLAAANSVIVLPEETTSAPAGAMVSVMRVSEEP